MTNNFTVFVSLTNSSNFFFQFKYPEQFSIFHVCFSFFFSNSFLDILYIYSILIDIFLIDIFLIYILIHYINTQCLLQTNTLVTEVVWKIGEVCKELFIMKPFTQHYSGRFITHLYNYYKILTTIIYFTSPWLRSINSSRSFTT